MPRMKYCAAVRRIGETLSSRPNIRIRASGFRLLAYAAHRGIETFRPFVLSGSCFYCNLPNPAKAPYPHTKVTDGHAGIWSHSLPAEHRWLAEARRPKPSAGSRSLCSLLKFVEQKEQHYSQYRIRQASQNATGPVPGLGHID